MEGSAAPDPSGYPVDVVIPRPAKTSRLLLFLRIILVIPQLLFALVIILVASVLTLINYVVVLITGRAVFVGFLSGTVRYTTRVNAYCYFLVDKYPPFSLGEAADYPVQVVIARPGKIHRWRIFSYILALPHFLILYGLAVLVSVTTLVAFFIVLIFGRYPPGLFGLAAMYMRYQARVAAYLYLVVDRYPPFALSASSMS
ncbi:MAG TPA: DUF4389 domain-containing protein [Solirubrobacteraceae bacterium]